MQIAYQFYQLRRHSFRRRSVPCPMRSANETWMQLIAKRLRISRDLHALQVNMAASRRRGNARRYISWSSIEWVIVRYSFERIVNIYICRICIMIVKCKINTRVSLTNFINYNVTRSRADPSRVRRALQMRRECSGGVGEASFPRGALRAKSDARRCASWRRVHEFPAFRAPDNTRVLWRLLFHIIMSLECGRWTCRKNIIEIIIRAIISVTTAKFALGWIITIRESKL